MIENHFGFEIGNLFWLAAREILPPQIAGLPISFFEDNRAARINCPELCFASPQFGDQRVAVAAVLNYPAMLIGFFTRVK